MNADPRPSPNPPGDEFIHHRWIRGTDVAWARDCNRILIEYGAVVGQTVYQRRHEARWRARKLIRLMVQLKLHDRWELREHTERTVSGGFMWTVEYLPGERKK